jgi:DNA-binding transcriptional LysR family regulator
MRQQDIPAGGRKRATDLNPQDLRAFVAVVEQKSFSRAAGLLGISQPTVSLRLQNLETQLGLRLIDRRQGSTPTATGRGLYNQARRALTELDALENFAREIEALEQGELRVGFSTPPVALALIGRFREAHPGVRLQLSQGNTFGLLERLRRSEIDVAVMTLRDPAEPEFAVTLIRRQRLAALVPVQHALAGAGGASWERIVQEPLLVRARPSMTHTQIEAELAARGLPLRPALELPSREAVKEAAACGLGLGLVFDTEIGADRRLAALPISDADGTAAMHAVALRDIAGLPAIAGFLDIARDSSRD